MRYTGVIASDFLYQHRSPNHGLWEAKTFYYHNFIIIIVLIIIIITNLVSPCYYPAIYLLPFRFLFLYWMVKYE